MNKTVFLLFLWTVIISACTAPKCPENACKVTFEHFHEGGVYRGKNYWTSKKYWPWNKEYGTSKKSEKTNDEKNKKWKKKFEWEKE